MFRHLAFALLFAMPGIALAQPVPAPEGAQRFLVLGADGVQVYACQPRDGALAWVFQRPEAILFDPSGREVGTHGAGPFWRLADGGAVLGEVAANAPAPAAGAIPWLLLRVRPRDGEGALTPTRFIRRIDTVAGVAPAGPCEAGATARMRYAAVYEYYR
jgi:hypothetical protein